MIIVENTANNGKRNSKRAGHLKHKKQTTNARHDKGNHKNNCINKVGHTITTTINNQTTTRNKIKTTRTINRENTRNDNRKNTSTTTNNIDTNEIVSQY